MRASPFLSLAVVTFALVAGERDASACGGCFHPPPGESTSVVTDHRMVLTVAKGKSTLYDQIKYTGSPSSFAWVLPIAGTVDIGLSSDLLFATLDGQTQTRLLQPPTNCPPQPSDCTQSGFASSSGASSSGATAGNRVTDGGISVLERAVVGPYETVQLSVDDGNPNALTDWLAKNGFVIPDDVKPMIAAYVNEKFNFAALKLVPGKGVQDMRPVRVTSTTPGASAVLPLRMVAVGTGATVGITLWVVAEGRYEPQNFPWFVLDETNVAWDWRNEKSNHVDVRAAKTAAANGRIWEVESSSDVFRANIESRMRSTAGPNTYLSETDSQGNVTKTGATALDEDLATLFDGIGATSRITRLRADLAHTALDQDLQMIASPDQAVIPTQRQLTQELNEPLCPVYDGCKQVGSLPRSEALARANASNAEASGSSCNIAPSGSDAMMSLSFGVAGLAFTRAMRRRRR